MPGSIYSAPVSKHILSSDRGVGVHPGCEVAVPAWYGNVLCNLDGLHCHHLAPLIHLLQQLIYPAPIMPAMLTATRQSKPRPHRAPEDTDWSSILKC